MLNKQLKKFYSGFYAIDKTLTYQLRDASSPYNSGILKT